MVLSLLIKSFTLQTHIKVICLNLIYDCIHILGLVEMNQCDLQVSLCE